MPARNVSDVLNLYLLLVGAHPGVRLDCTSFARHRGVLEPWETSNLLRVFRSEARASGLRVAVVLGYEPIVVNLQLVNMADVVTIRKLYTKKRLARCGDMNEPLVSAIGRALGYGCGPSGLRDVESRKFVSLDVVLHSSNTVRRAPLRLAAFGCAKNDARELVDHWANARSALEGQVVRFRGRKYTIEAASTPSRSQVHHRGRGRIGSRLETLSGVDQVGEGRSAITRSRSRINTGP